MIENNTFIKPQKNTIYNVFTIKKVGTNKNNFIGSGIIPNHTISSCKFYVKERSESILGIPFTQRGTSIRV